MVCFEYTHPPYSISAARREQDRDPCSVSFMGSHNPTVIPAAGQIMWPYMATKIIVPKTAAAAAVPVVVAVTVPLATFFHPRPCTSPS